MKHIVSWSGGKDSTATIILAHELGLPIDLIVMSLLWFDKERGIYAEHPKHIDWVFNYAKPLFESWGYKVEFIHSDKDYLHYFYKVRRKSKHPEYVGKYYGWLLGGMCKMQGEKERPIKHYLKALGKPGVDYEEYVGICHEEVDRLETLSSKRGKRSILDENGYTQKDSRQKCIEYRLLSPTYSIAKRGGCWFCPNQSIKELADIKTNHPEYWNELVLLNTEVHKGTTIQRGFSYGKSFDEISAQVDTYIASPHYTQITIEDLLRTGGDAV